MLYDLNVPWSSTNTITLQRTLSLLSELNYSTIAFNHFIESPIPSQIINPIPTSFSFPIPKSMTVLRRCTLIISDPTLNHRLPALSTAYDILALRPTTEKAFLFACTSAPVALISLDLTIRYPFHFRPGPFMTAIKRGVRFEICYAQTLAGGNGTGGVGGDSIKRRNFIGNVLAIARATRGRGLVISSEARSVLGLRAQADVGNLLGIWGVSRERATEAQTVGPRGVVVNEGIGRRGFRGIVDVIEGGERMDDTNAVTSGTEKKKPNGKGPVKNNVAKGKRKLDDGKEGDEMPKMSKRQEKRLRLAAATKTKTSDGETTLSTMAAGAVQDSKDTPGTEIA